MSSDYSVEQMEDEHNEAEKRRFAIQVAIPVAVDCSSRSSATEDVRNRFSEQADAITNGKVFDAPSGGKHDFHNQALNDRDIPKGMERQVEAIANEVMEDL